MGIKYAPAVVDVWRDMAPGSAFLSGLFASKLPDGTSHHLIFTFGRNPTSFGISDDETVSVASQLHAVAQGEATHVYGVDDTHTGVLRNTRKRGRLHAGGTGTRPARINISRTAPSRPALTAVTSGAPAASQTPSVTCGT